MDELKAYFSIKENKTALICALVHLAISVGTDFIAFTELSLLYIFFKPLFAFILFFLWKAILTAYHRIKACDEKTLIRLKLFMVYFAFSMVLLILIWPGNWTNDDIITYDFYASKMQLYYWQHYLTSVYYILCLMLIPFPTGIAIIQLVIISLIISDCISWVYEKTGKRKSAFALFIPFLFLPVIFQNYYTLRLSLCAYFDLYLIKTLAALYLEKKPVRTTQLILPGFLTVILAVWRSENIYYAILMPLLFICMFFKTTTKKQKIAFSLSVLIFSATLTLSQNMGVKQQEDGYSDTALTSFMELYFRAEEEGDTEFVNAVEKVYSRGLLHWGREQEIPCGSLMITYSLKRPDVSPEDESAFMKEFVKAIIKYPDTFLSERFDKYLNNYKIMTDLHDISVWHGLYYIIDNNFRAAGLLTEAPFPELRYDILSVIYMHPDKDMLTHSVPFKIVWSQVPPTILMLLCTVILLIKKKYAYAGLLACSLIKNPLIFLTTPSYFFMYYFPVYLCGYALTAALLYFAVYNKKAKHESAEPVMTA